MADNVIILSGICVVLMDDIKETKLKKTERSMWVRSLLVQEEKEEGFIPDC